MVLIRAVSGFLPRCASRSVFTCVARGGLLQVPTRSSMHFFPKVRNATFIVVPPHRAMSSAMPYPPRNKDAKGTGDQPYPKKMLLYELSTKKLLKISCAVSIVSGVYWVGYIQLMGSFQPAPGYAFEPWGLLGLGMSGVLVASSWFFARRLVDKAWYLPATHSLAYSTHFFSSRAREPIAVPIGQIRAAKRTRKSSFYAFKAKGDTGYTLLDSSDGIYYHKDFLFRLLDGTISADAAAAASKGGKVAAIDTGDHSLMFRGGKRGKKVIKKTNDQRGFRR